jgi:hypothetical protein
MITSDLSILQHLENRLNIIKVANGYNNNIAGVDREYVERSYDNYPFFFINDVDDKYLLRICKDLYQKGLVIQIIGFVYSDRTASTEPQLGTKLQLLKDDLRTCFARDTFFNASYAQLDIIEIETDSSYVPPQASFVCNLLVIHYDNK